MHGQNRFTFYKYNPSGAFEHKVFRVQKKWAKCNDYEREIGKKGNGRPAKQDKSVLNARSEASSSELFPPTFEGYIIIHPPSSALQRFYFDVQQSSGNEGADELAQRDAMSIRDSPQMEYRMRYHSPSEFVSKDRTPPLLL